MLEFILIGIVCLFIAVLFYKQANEQFEILQLSGDRLKGQSELPTLYGERSPIVITDLPLPPLGNSEALSKRPSLMNRQVRMGQSLSELIAAKSDLETFVLPRKTAEFLARESGLSVWFEQTLYTSLLPSPYTRWFYSKQTYLWPHHRGLFQTTAHQTLILPTEGNLIVSLMFPKMIPYLPSDWKGKPFNKLSLNDTPLLSQIQFIEIKVKKGNAVLLPAHLICDITSSEEKCAWIFIAELHHPISLMASKGST